MDEYFDIIDSRDLGVIDGFQVHAFIVPDNDTEDDLPINMSYVGLIVIASRAGVNLGSDSLWECEHGYLPDSVELITPLYGEGTWASYGPDMIANAIADANLKLSELAAATAKEN